MIKIKDMKCGDDNVGFTAMISHITLGKTNGAHKSNYLSIVFQDETGTIDAKLWNASQEHIESLKAGAVVRAKGDIIKYSDNRQMKIISIDDVSYQHSLQLQFLAKAPMNDEMMMTELKQYVQRISNPKLYVITKHLIEQNFEKMKIYPAASKNHHAFTSGLAYHTLSMLKVADALMSVYSELNADLLYAGILLHDIGKSLDHEMEGSHIQIGSDLCRKYKESPIVINAVESHHGDVEPETLIACVVQAADTISAARPGARRETIETYTNRLKQLEEISNQFKGVDKSFAIQAGREIRVMVVPEQVSDDDMVLMARNIAKQIEFELEYPGQIKVNVIRESRVSDYAK